MAEKRPSTQELRAVPEAELAGQVEQLRRELWQHRLKAKDGSLQQTHVLPALKRHIARIHTVLRERRVESPKQAVE